MLLGLRSRLARFIGARPEEVPLALGLFLFNFLVITAYLIVKPVRNSMFLERLGAERLPLAYIGTALFVGVVVWAYFKVLERLSRSLVLALTWGSLSLGLVGFWMGFQSPGVMVSAFFYFYSAVFSVVGVTQFWSFASESLDAEQGKRLFGFLGAGGIVGGLAGGSLTHALAQTIGTEQLLLVSAGLCLLCGVLAVTLSETYPSRALSQAKSETQEASASEGLRAILESRYLLFVIGVLFCFQLTGTLVDFQFNRVVGETLIEKDARTAFYGSFFLWLGIAGLLFQTFCTTRILQRYGIGLALAVLPGVALVGGLGFFMVPLFAVGVGAKMSFGAIDYSLDRATREVLYLPTSQEVKGKAKAFIDMFCFRFFRCIAGCGILAWTHFELSPALMSLAVAALAVVWFAFTREIVASYPSQLRSLLFGDSELPEDLGQAPDRDAIHVEIGYEIARFVRDLEAKVPRAPDRLEGLVAKLIHPSEVAAVFELRRSAKTKALAEEYLLCLAEKVGEGRLVRQVLRTSDPARLDSSRILSGRRLSAQIGLLPLRPEPRLVWDPAGSPA